eukprot:TRINITY_DN4360_c0_g1_i1.p1 TRINITY_DN4360_c0_g1~~TRINITY_DN4360_c0_g1_i1.p1  ORF type:complete len:284 (+),score=64.90 TRINITY_DN4360_c0_g1_i1:86-937(+)
MAADVFSLSGLGVVMLARCSYSVASDAAAQLAEGAECISVTRAARFAGVGTLWLSPVSYLQWLLVNNLLPGTSVAAAVAKTGVDLLVIRPVNGLTAMALCEALRSNSWERVKGKVRQDFIPLQLGTSSLRLGANLVCFLAFPHVTQQMLFLTAVHFGANVWASHRVHLPVGDDHCSDSAPAASAVPSVLPTAGAAAATSQCRAVPDRSPPRFPSPTRRLLQPQQPQPQTQRLRARRAPAAAAAPCATAPLEAFCGADFSAPRARPPSEPTGMLRRSLGWLRRS